jgi:protein-S-isoprenylcysteine O-methyltransferase Ste14
MTADRRADLKAAAFTFLTAALWAGALPAALLRDESGAMRLVWRPVPLIVLGGLVLTGGTALVYLAGGHLARAGAHLVGVRPGPVLVTDGWYARVRNPQNIGTTLMALAPALALAPAIMWMLPLVAAVWMVVGLEPLEDRRLLEVFGDDFRAYRARVRAWLPRLGR